MNLANALARSVERCPEKPALFWGERVYAYRELWEMSLGTSFHLRNHLGVRPGDRVALWLKNRPEFISSFFGILLSGACVVPINSFLKPDEVSFILEDAGIDLLVTDTELGTHARPLTSAHPRLKLFLVDDPPKPTHPVQHWAIPKTRSSDLAVLIYTSGTTGRPKGAMLSHGNLLHNVESCRIVLRTVEADRFVVLLPLFHSYMLTVGMLLPLVVGGSLLLVKSLHPVRNVILDIIQHQATVMPAIPQFYRSIVNAPGHITLPLRVCISGAAPLPVQVLKEFEARFHIPLIEGYGLSEASPVVTKNPLDGTRKVGSIGLPIPNVEVSIQNDAGQALEPGEVGEICVRGGNVMLGYWQKPEETAKVMRDGWLLTGDLGYRDTEGYFFVTDRKKDMLLVNGINVYPREVEEVIYQFPGIKEAAVIGKADVRKGEYPVAFVSLNDEASLDEKALRHFLRKRLADYKVPRKILVMNILPRNAGGKILKTALRDVPLELDVD